MKIVLSFHPLFAYILIVFTSNGSAAPSTQLQAPAWLAGQWCSQSGKDTIEEHWMPASGSFMIGMSRTRTALNTKSFEFLRIQPVEGQMALIAQPGGGKPTVFKQTASENNWMRFENPTHDFPKRIEYRRNKNKLTAVIAGPGEDGREMEIPFHYQLCEQSRK
jgi:Domain of unknown function (DUF6265)